MTSILLGAVARAEDNAITRPMPSALVNRMFHVELKASPRLWLEWAARSGIHPYVYDYICSRPDHLWSKPPKTEEPFSTPRSWHMLSDAIQSYGENISEDDLRILAAGSLSPRHATQFLAYVRQVRSRYALDKILAGAPPWPSDPEARDVRYVLAQSLRARLVKELPPERCKLTGDSRTLVLRAKDRLVELADLSLEIARMAVTPEDDMPPGYEPIAQAGELALWKNPDALPLAFVPAGECPDLDRAADYDCFVRQNALISGLTQANTSVFTPVEAVTEAEGTGGTVFIFTGVGKPIYADLSASGLTEVLVNGERVLSLGSSEAACVHYLGTPGPGEEWTVTVRHSGSWTGRLWELDQGSLRAVLGRLDNTEILSVGKNGRVRLTAQSPEGRPLLTTIPAEDGWAAWVDGRRVDTGVWLEAFLTVPLPAGEHQVELRYTAPGLAPGIALGALALAGLALVNAGGRWNKRKKRGNAR